MIVTQSIKYAGSKLKLLPYIMDVAKSTSSTSVFDAFSGTTRVSQAFAKAGYTVVSNDVSEWSYILGLCYLMNKNKSGYYQELINHLNAVRGYEGWFTKNYGGLDHNGSSIQADGLKKLWQFNNTMKLDGIRDEIDSLNLSEIERAVAITSLMLALDRVDNTMGHFVSYLSKWSPRSYKDLHLEVPDLWANERDHTVLKGDIFKSIETFETDLIYLDPPYGSNNDKMPSSRVRYQSYYHIWTTLCKHDKPSLFGAAGRRVDSSDRVSGSLFEEFRKDESGQSIALKAVKDLIELANARYVMLSYSSGGRATFEELMDILNSNGRLLKSVQVDYKKNVMAEMRWTREWVKTVENQHKEFIFLIEK